MTNKYSGGISTKPSHPDSDTRLKALVAATPVLGTAARTLSRIRMVKELRGLRHCFRGSSISVLQKIIGKIIQYVSTIVFFCFYRPTRSNKHTDRKVIFIRIKNNYFRRYLYLFLKFFYLEGYAVYIPLDLKLMYVLKNEPYASYLVKERIVHFGKPPAKARVLQIDEHLISPDYFTGLRHDEKSSFHVPMTQHPAMYHLGFWNAAVKNRVRKRSVFMAGNFDPVAYSKMEKDGIFGLLSRSAIYAYLERKQLLCRIPSKNKLADFLENKDDHKIILINRLVFDIPMNELRPLLGKFDFYFALPGVVMPFAHNVVEAMSAGAIPFLQDGYANLFQPALIDGLQAVTFKDINDLEARLNYLLGLSPETTARMRENVWEYYHNYLTPHSVVASIEKGDYDKIYLQAEHYSVELLKNKSKGM